MYITHKLLIRTNDIEKTKNFLRDYFEPEQPCSNYIVEDLGNAILVFSAYSPTLMHASIFINEDKAINLVRFFIGDLLDAGFDAKIVPVSTRITR